MLLGTGSTQLISLLVQTVLARLLIPSDFGAVALSVSLLAILSVFAEMGTAAALIQRKELSSSALDSAFFVTFLSTITISCGLYLVAPFFANQFREPRLHSLVHVVALTYVFKGFFSLQRCLLLRELRYRTVALLQLVDVGIAGIIAVLLARYGFGPMSMIAGQAVSAGAVLFIATSRTGRRPRSFGSWREAKELLTFGLWVSGGRTLGAASAQFDKFVLGYVLSPTAVGVYWLSQRLAMVVSQTLTSILDQVSFPIYSRIQEDVREVERGYMQTLLASAMLALPAALLIALTANSLVPLMFGGRWDAAIPVIRILALGGAIHGLGGGVFGSVVLALGRPKLNVWQNGFRIVVLPFCILAGSRWGLLGVSWGFVLFAVLGRVYNQWLLKAHFKFSFFSYFRCIAKPVTAALVAGLCGASASLGLRSLEMQGHFFPLAIVGSTFLAVYVFCVFRLLPRQARIAWKYLWGRLKGLKSVARPFFPVEP